MFYRYIRTSKVLRLYSFLIPSIPILRPSSPAQVCRPTVESLSDFAQDVLINTHSVSTRDQHSTNAFRSILIRFYERHWQRCGHSLTYSTCSLQKLLHPEEDHSITLHFTASFKRYIMRRNNDSTLGIMATSNKLTITTTLPFPPQYPCLAHPFCLERNASRRSSRYVTARVHAPQQLKTQPHKAELAHTACRWSVAGSRPLRLSPES